MELDQARHFVFVRPDLNPNDLQWLSAEGNFGYQQANSGSHDT